MATCFYQKCPKCGDFYDRDVVKACPTFSCQDGTVDFLAAMKAAREGKRVKRENESCWHFWDRERDRLSREPDKTNCAINAEHLDARWEIEQPPPREYTFLEAVEMMKAGQRMRPKMVIAGHYFHFDGSLSWVSPHGTNGTSILYSWITDQWVHA
jgi:hypothetical protein